jgi:hypothetical protein
MWKKKKEKCLVSSHAILLKLLNVYVHYKLVSRFTFKQICANISVSHTIFVYVLWHSALVYYDLKLFRTGHNDNFRFPAIESNELYLMWLEKLLIFMCVCFVYATTGVYSLSMCIQLHRHMCACVRLPVDVCGKICNL